MQVVNDSDEVWQEHETSAVQQCVIKFKSMLGTDTHFRCFLIPSARGRAEELLREYAGARMTLEPASRQALDQRISEHLASVHSVLHAVDKCNMVIDNEFDEKVCMIPAEVEELIEKARAFASKRYTPGSPALDRLFERACALIGDLVRQHNAIIRTQELKLREGALRLVVDQFYAVELKKLATVNNGVQTDRLFMTKNANLQSDAVQILAEISGGLSSAAKEGLEQAVRKQMEIKSEEMTRKDAQEEKRERRETNAAAKSKTRKRNPDKPINRAPKPEPFRSDPRRIRRSTSNNLPGLSRTAPPVTLTGPPVRKRKCVEFPECRLL